MSPQPIHLDQGVPLFFFLVNLFIFYFYFWLHWVFVAAHGLSLVVLSGGYSLLWCVGFSLRWLLVAEHGLQAHGLSSCGSRALERRLSSCGARAQLLRGMWDLPRPGLEPVSPALAGRFSTTAPPGKPQGIPLTSVLATLCRWAPASIVLPKNIILKLVPSTSAAQCDRCPVKS